MTNQASTLLITSMWADKPTFRLMPVTKDSLYVECIYDTESKVLVVITNVKKDSFHMVPKMNAEGDPTKSKGTRANGKNYQEERRQLETFQEYYITEKEEIKEFIKLVALNADTFDYNKYLDKSNIITEVEAPKIILQGN